MGLKLEKSILFAFCIFLFMVGFYIPLVLIHRFSHEGERKANLWSLSLRKSFQSKKSVVSDGDSIFSLCSLSAEMDDLAAFYFLLMHT
jgi:ABC-type spermidine/putrescine transport system permease subunit II